MLAILNAARTLRPAGPPPTQTTSYSSDDDSVAYARRCRGAWREQLRQIYLPKLRVVVLVANCFMLTFGMCDVEFSCAGLIGMMVFKRGAKRSYWSLDVDATLTAPTLETKLVSSFVAIYLPTSRRISIRYLRY